MSEKSKGKQANIFVWTSVQACSHAVFLKKEQFKSYILQWK